MSPWERCGTTISPRAYLGAEVETFETHPQPSDRVRYSAKNTTNKRIQGEVETFVWYTDLSGKVLGTNIDDLPRALIPTRVDIAPKASVLMSERIGTERLECPGRSNPATVQSGQHSTTVWKTLPAGDYLKFVEILVSPDGFPSSDGLIRGFSQPLPFTINADGSVSGS